MTGMTECGTCGFRWNDSIVTDRTPVRSPRTPCEPWHVYDDSDEFVAVDVPPEDAAFIEQIEGSWPEVSDPVRFFYEHAGWSYDKPNGETSDQGHIRCARALAAAEREAERRGWWHTAETDPDGPMEDDAGSVESVQSGEMVCLMVTLFRGSPDGPEVLGCIGDVIVPSDSDPYLRVVAAELADDVLGSDPLDVRRVAADVETIVSDVAAAGHEGIAQTLRTAVDSLNWWARQSN